LLLIKAQIVKKIIIIKKKRLTLCSILLSVKPFRRVYCGLFNLTSKTSD